MISAKKSILPKLLIDFSKELLEKLPGAREAKTKVIRSMVTKMMLLILMTLERIS